MIAKKGNNILCKLGFHQREEMISGVNGSPFLPFTGDTYFTICNKCNRVSKWNSSCLNGTYRVDAESKELLRMKQDMVNYLSRVDNIKEKDTVNERILRISDVITYVERYGTSSGYQLSKGSTITFLVISICIVGCILCWIYNI